MEPKAILDALGGYRTVADHLHIAPHRVHNWTRRGIAREFWPDIVAMAKRRRKGHLITFDVLKRARPEPAEADDRMIA